MAFGFTLSLLVLIAESNKSCSMMAGLLSKNGLCLLSGECSIAVSNIHNIQIHSDVIIFKSIKLTERLKTVILAFFTQKYNMLFKTD